MNKAIAFLIAALVAFSGLAITTMPAAQAVTGKTHTAPKRQNVPKCITAPSATVVNGLTVLQANACFNKKAFVKKGCKAYAAKHEQPAPPRDPQAKCKGKIKIVVYGEISTPPCPTGYWGSPAHLRIRLVNVLKARSFAKSIASGRVRTWARVKLVDKIRIDGSASSSCVQVPVTPPPAVELEKPTITAQAQACVKPGEATGVISGIVGNPNNAADIAVISIGNQSVEKSVSAGGTVPFSFSGFAPGTYTVNVTLKNAKKSASTTVTVEKCDVPTTNNPPTGNISALPHQYASPTDSTVGYVYIVASDADGDTVTLQSVNAISSNGAAARIGNILPSNVTADGSPCPTGSKCWRVEVWAGKTPGNVKVRALITDGKSSPVELITDPWPIMPDDRG